MTQDFAPLTALLARNLDPMKPRREFTPVMDKGKNWGPGDFTYLTKGV